MNKISLKSIPETHRRAAVWLAEHAEIEEAVAHALKSGEMEPAAELVEAGARILLLRGEFRTL